MCMPYVVFAVHIYIIIMATCLIFNCQQRVGEVRSSLPHCFKPQVVAIKRKRKSTRRQHHHQVITSHRISSHLVIIRVSFSFVFRQLVCSIYTDTDTDRFVYKYYIQSTRKPKSIMRNCARCLSLLSVEFLLLFSSFQFLNFFPFFLSGSRDIESFQFTSLPPRTGHGIGQSFELFLSVVTRSLAGLEEEYRM